VTEADLGALVRMLQEKTPLHQLSSMEARTVFEFLQQRGYVIILTPTERAQHMCENA
jgi:hypothetical protein